jgi:hypothetical protein
MIRSRVEPAEGRKRSWVAPSGQPVTLPLTVSAWEDHPITGERMWTVTARVELIDKRPQTTDVSVRAEDGLDVERLQREFRWKTPADIVSVWVPDVLAAGGDLGELEPPSNWWTTEGRHELSDEFLAQIAEEYLRLGRGYAKQMAITYRTGERTVRSWVDKARERGILGPAPGKGRIGGTFAIVMTEED